MKRSILTFVQASILALTVSVVGVQAKDVQVLKAGDFSFALSGKYPPFNFINDSGNLDGFDVDVGKEISKRISLNAAPVTTAWDGIIAGLLAKKYDTILGSMAITDERLKVVNFSDPYYRSGAQLFVGNNSNVKSIADMNGKKVGVTLGTTFEKWVRENAPEVEVVTYKGVPEMMLELGSNRIAGFITDKLVGVIAINEKNVPITLAGDLLYPELVGIAVHKGNPELLKAINQSLADMKNDGTYATISKKWFKTDIR